MTLFEFQYREVMGSRQVVLNFCDSFREGDYTKEITFDGKSIAQLQVHIANTYVGWLSAFQQRQPQYFSEAAYKKVDAMRDVFKRVDESVIDFLQRWDARWNDPVNVEVKKQIRSLNAANIFTHIITHEFHHKGQILMLARTLGYTPPDTDIIRF